MSFINCDKDKKSNKELEELKKELFKAKEEDKKIKDEEKRKLSEEERKRVKSSSDESLDQLKELVSVADNLFNKGIDRSAGD